jgi:hypothetical protein
MMSNPIWQAIQEQLAQQGIDVDSLAHGDLGDARVRAICVVPDLGASVRAMAEFPRDQVVMVRVDAESAKALDAWVQSGAVKSRSEAAALFIREGLNVHARELGQLQDALREVEEAKRRLKEKAKDVLKSEEKR